MSTILEVPQISAREVQMKFDRLIGLESRFLSRARKGRDPETLQMAHEVLRGLADYGAIKSEYVNPHHVEVRTYATLQWLSGLMSGKVLSDWYDHTEATGENGGTKLTADQKAEVRRYQRKYFQSLSG